MKKRLFGTDGIRGVANVYPLTGDVLYKISKIAAGVLKNRKEKGRSFVFIGKDTRLSCDMLETAIASGLMSEGIDVYRLGVIPTPALAWLTKKKKALFGIMISASHNPFYDNGIKFISSSGFKLPDDVEIEIEKKYFDGFTEAPVTHQNIGKMYEKFNYVDDYVEHILQGTEQFDFSSYRILVDCANGATSEIMPYILERLGVRYQIVDNNPTGDNINNECGSTNLEKIQKIVREEDFDCGIAFDGDGDRCLMVDDTGEVMDGDIMMSLYFVHRADNDSGFNHRICATVMSNMGLKKVIAEHNGEFLETKVGDKYVLEKMRETDCIIGGEQSGHIIYLEKNTTGDGPLSAIEMLKIMAGSGKKFSKLIAFTGFTRYPQVILNVTVKDKSGLWDIEELNTAVSDFEEEFREKGRILIRPSGTEPFVRVMAEALEIEKARKRLNDITRIIEKKLG